MMRGDGDNKAWSPGRARISRKTIAQGMPAAPAEPVVLPRAFLLHADHGCSPHPAFPAPSDFDEGGLNGKTRTPRAARIHRYASLRRHATRMRGIQYSAASRLKRC